ncbi:MAG: PQQ-dependent sugar dehydrogenase [Verrucomicrobia bacterium]|nr:PQQ-dependent sugar dehydrogenase [Verrucomicrobiota bacterium]
MVLLLKFAFCPPALIESGRFGMMTETLRLLQATTRFKRAQSILVSLVCFGVLSSVRVYATTLPADFVEQTIGGTWNEAVGLTVAPDGRMFVWERAGRVWIVENGTNKLAQPLIDINDEVAGYRDFGLLGFALDPNFHTNGYIYLMYVVDHYHLVNSGLPGYNASSNDYYRATIGRITRYTANAADGFHTVNTNSRLILLGERISNAIPILHESHGVVSLVFGADRTLLASCCGPTRGRRGSLPGLGENRDGASNEQQASQGCGFHVIGGYHFQTIIATITSRPELAPRLLCTGSHHGFTIAHRHHEPDLPKLCRICDKVWKT